MLEKNNSPTVSPSAAVRINQQIFTFESAKLQRVNQPLAEKKSGWLVEEISGWLNIVAPEERPRQNSARWQTQTTLRKAKCFMEDLGHGVNLQMVYIPAGTFLMGESPLEVDSFQPHQGQQQVAIPTFYLGRYPVTQDQYLAIMGNNPAAQKGSWLPVENISWHDAQQFCQRLSAKTGRKYRLPWETEWEYACRAGSTTPYYFGEKITTEIANFRDKSVDRVVSEQLSSGQRPQKTNVVGSFPANDFGLSDMHGNVWEWCLDSWYPNQTSNDNEKVLRGGSWLRVPSICRSAYRYKYASDFRFNDIGFRVVYDFSKTF